MNQSSRQSPRQQNQAARYFPAVAAAAVVGAVVIAGVAGGLGGGGSGAKPTVTNTTIAPSTAGLPPSTQAIVTESTAAPLVTTALSGPLAYGSAGDQVRSLQERLTELGFFVGPIDGQFGNLTKMAVWAFEKLVMQVPRDEASGVVTDEMWQVMQQPMRIEPRRKYTDGETSANHTEVYLPEQVVVFFRDDEAVLVSHMSSGTGQEWKEVVTIDVGEYGNNTDEPIVRREIGISVTPGGVFDYDRMIEGLRQSALGGLWDPAYFNYGIAIHGALNVPLEPASHGCIRVPLKVGEMFHELIAVGDQVWVWDGVKEPETYGAQVPTFNTVDPTWSTTTTFTTVAATTPITVRPQTTPPATPAPTPPPTAAPTAAPPTAAPPAPPTAPPPAPPTDPPTTTVAAPPATG